MNSTHAHHTADGAYYTLPDAESLAARAEALRAFNDYLAADARKAHTRARRWRALAAAMAAVGVALAAWVAWG